MKKLVIIAASFIIATLSFSGCATSNTAGGAAAGAVGGAIIGGMVGDHRDAMIGAAGGAVAGAMIGKELDDQEREDRNQYR